jgi:gliding motility-associated-like protein
MKVVSQILLLVGFCLSLEGQNLIQNPYFANQNPNSSANKGIPPNVCTAGIHTDCYDCVMDWYGVNSFYDLCVQNGSFRPWAHPGGIFPANFPVRTSPFRMIDAVIGTGFGGFFLGTILPANHTNSPGYPNTGTISHAAKALTQKLNTSLEKDSVYVLEFYTSRHLVWLIKPIAKLHAFFYTGHSDSDYVDMYPLNYGRIIPERESPTTEWNGEIPINEWKLISMSFTATGDEKSFYILRFKDPDSLYADVEGDTYFLFADAFALYKASDTLYSVSIGNDTLLCPGEELSLTANLDDGFKLEDSVTTFLWSTGDTVPQITVNSPGTYWVEVTINHRFKQRDSIVVEYEDPIVWQAPFGESETIEKCYEVLPWVVSGPETSHDALYLWSTGENSQSIKIRHEDVYRLRIITPCFDEEGEFYFKPIDCNVDSSAFRGNIYIPSAFTPQGRNPLWIIGGIPPNTRVEVYSRWGQRIFYSEDYLHNWWDGTINGQPAPPGSYTYRIVAPFEGQDPVDKTGTVTIVR